MSLINVKNLTFSYPGSADEVFSDVSFDIESDWKIGIIGRNGIGKTTLLNILRKDDRKEFSNLDFEYFPYSYKNTNIKTEELILNELGPYIRLEKEMEAYETTFHEEQQDRYMEALSEYMEIDGYNIRTTIVKELSMLGLSGGILERNFDTLSNGEKTKITIVLMFLKNNAYLLLDEPTNHLDYHARLKLAEYLNEKKNYILVSHDRELINRCVDHIMYIGKDFVRIEKGNYNTWKYNQDGRDSHFLAETAKAKTEKERLQSSIDNLKEWADNAGESSQGKFNRRIKNMERRQQEIAKNQTKFINEKERNGKIRANSEIYRQNRLMLFNKVNIEMNGKVLLQDLDHEVNQGDRIALIGKNGCGKSTLIKSIVKAGTEGYEGISYNKDLKISYVKQDASLLTGTLDELAVKHNVDDSLLRSLIYQLGVERKDLNKRIEEMSEGQKKKTMIAASLVEKSNIYIWDEPMNYLDVACREIMEEMILRQNLTMIFVEHDISFVDKIATKRIDFDLLG